MATKHYTIPVFIPGLACPFQCVFCNRHKITGKQLIPDDGEIIQIIDGHLLTFKEKKREVEIGFFGGSFTGIPFDLGLQMMTGLPGDEKLKQSGFEVVL